MATVKLGIKPPGTRIPSSLLHRPVRHDREQTRVLVGTPPHTQALRKPPFSAAKTFVQTSCKLRHRIDKKMDDDDLPGGLTQEEIDEYREAFGMFDINGDGASRRVILLVIVMVVG
jgi:hypothetical protein